MLRGALLALVFASVASPLVAASLSVRVVDAAGKPVRDAVVIFRPDGSAARAPRLSGRYEVSQKNLQFHPFVTVIPVGADVSFPNLDSTKHHVYSFSPAKRFELKLFARDQSRTVHFDKAGVVALGCNIHDQMSAFIVVTDSVWTGRTNAQGVVTFADAPSANGHVSVWHPFMRLSGSSLDQAIGSQQHFVAFTIRLRPPPPAMTMDY